MADLFDMKVGGLGFHLTAHMIALAALFVACFAITGYISFRNGTITEDKLDGANFLTDGEAMTSLTMGSLVEKIHYEQVTVPILTNAANDSVATLALSLPEGAIVIAGMIVMPTAATGTDLGDFNLECGSPAECAVGVGTGGGADISGACDSQGTTLVSRTAFSGGLDIVAQAADDNSFCIAATAATTSTAACVVDCYIKVLYPKGVTPV